jgi:signal transduction histidine kinase
VWAAATAALESGAPLGPSLRLFGVWLLLNLSALAVAVLTLGGIRKATPANAYQVLSQSGALALSYGAYAAAGLLGGLVRLALAAAVLTTVGAHTSAIQMVSNVLMIAIGAVVLGFMANTYNAFIDRLQTQQATLQKQVQELEQSRQLITTAEENLRREIAELLHGRVQSRLVVAWHRLGQCEKLMATDPAEAKALLVQVREEIDQIREHEVRQASHLLHPSIIQVGLVPAVRSLIQRFSAGFQIALHIDPKLADLDDPAGNRIPEPVRLVAYRVLEEALNNINRHAHASRVDISLAAGADQRLGVVVLDNGRGFDPDKLKHGLGLNTISARVGQYGGMWFISSAPGRGTRVSAFLPLHSPQEASKETAYDNRHSVWDAPQAAKAQPAAPSHEPSKKQAESTEVWDARELKAAARG